MENNSQEPSSPPESVFNSQHKKIWKIQIFVFLHHPSFSIPVRIPNPHCSTVLIKTADVWTVLVAISENVIVTNLSGWWVSQMPDPQME